MHLRDARNCNIYDKMTNITDLIMIIVLLFCIVGVCLFILSFCMTTVITINANYTFVNVIKPKINLINMRFESE